MASFEELADYFVGKEVTEEYFPEASEPEKIIMPWITISALLGFIFLVVFEYGIRPFPGKYAVYLIMFFPIGAIALILNVSEMVRKKETPWGASSTFLGDYTFPKIFFISIGVSLIFIIPNILGIIKNSSVSFLSLSISGLPSLFSALLVLGLFIPIIENAFFAKYLVPSMFELGGKLRIAGIIGLFIPALIFAFIHFASTPLLSGLIFVFFFRFITSLLILATGSYLLALIPHILINSTLILLEYSAKTM